MHCGSDWECSHVTPESPRHNGSAAAEICVCARVGENTTHPSRGVPLASPGSGGPGLAGDLWRPRGCLWLSLAPNPPLPLRTPGGPAPSVT
ncbi:hypothetical protein AAFF_G00039910 [Aldrovandia affinis]|uniref:Uncharacterized protein n=1 Tax=Aldrovandia affinis TaxID=143900 RepID=A0AAD7WFU3_9TELE|nr:hypothetical protein AAFF_G00039910 [Aldrovandia affinis]